MSMASADNSRRVLVADDNEDATEILAMLLTERGNEVRIAHDGEQAVAVELEFNPEVVLLDIGLPKLSGYAVARRIRSVRGRDVLIIAITGMGQEDDRQRARDAGFDHHITKPIDFNVLLGIIDKESPPPRDSA
jgi:DNA-binding response OmpR family regulator